MENTFLITIWIHFIADFVLQSDTVAINKSKKIRYLALHCFIYSVPFLYFGFWFAVITGVLHCLIDFVTSRINSWLWQNEKRHWFFVTIGLDQAIHLSCLVLLLKSGM